MEFERCDSRRLALKEEAEQQIHDSQDAAASKQDLLVTIQVQALAAARLKFIHRDH